MGSNYVFEQLPVKDSSDNLHIESIESHVKVHENKRWVVLFLACSLLFGNYYAYDTPAALNTGLQEWLGTPDSAYQFQINLIYSVYALPNMFLPLFGGGLMDRFGTSSLMQVLSVIICCGQLIFGFGVQWRSLPIMLLGRVLFGIGGESLSVAQTRMTTKYFRGKELALALGINLSVARLGSVANDLLSPYLASVYSVPFAIHFGLVTCLASLLCSFTLSIMDLRQAREFSEGTLHGAVNWSAPFSFSRSYWFVILIMVTLYGTIVPFNTIHQAFLQSKDWWYPGDPVRAAQVMGIPDTVSALLVPFVGVFTDKVGFRPQTLFVCAATITLVHICLGHASPSLTPTPTVPLFFLGASYSCLLVFWPCIPIVVPEASLATAYGLATALLNACYFFFPITTAFLTNRDPTFTLTENMFAVFGVAGMCACLSLWYVDLKDNGCRLALPEKMATLDRKTSVEVVFDSIELDETGEYSHINPNTNSTSPMYLKMKKRKNMLDSEASEHLSPTSPSETSTSQQS